MLGLSLGFTAPLVLAALAGLPVLYYLLRITPPRPSQVPFPPLQLILDHKPTEETPARTPWWLLALRLALAALAIFAMAGPLLNPLLAGNDEHGPLVLLIDDGWPAAPDWARRVTAATQRIEAAGREGRPSAILAFSEGQRDLVLADAGKTLERLRALAPQPYVSSRLPALAPLRKLLAAQPQAELVWIADGLDLGAASEFAKTLAGEHQLTLLQSAHLPLALTGAESLPGALEISVLRPGAAAAPDGLVRALDQKGLNIANAPFHFADGNVAKASFQIPMELRNEIARLDIVGEESAGAVALLDERWKRRRIGLVSGASADIAQPLLAPSYYLTRALAPFAEVREAKTSDPVNELLDARVSVLILADVGIVAGPAHDRLRHFVEDGGVLLRFAGVRMAGSTDDLVPVKLRRGGRILGGSLSWDTPKKLAPFDRESPFFGLPAPEEVTVSRQVLAEPEPGLRPKTWAALADGTPLVTAERRGKGLIALVHVSADTTWSSLPLSGLFVGMLQRVVAMAAQGVAIEPGKDEAREPASLAPARTLNGFGALGAPPANAKPVPANFAGPASADHPPGFYGPAEAPLALNTLEPGVNLAAASYPVTGVTLGALALAEPVDLRPWFIAAVFALFLADALASLWLAGSLRPGWRKAPALAVLALAIGFALAPVPDALAQTISPRDFDAALKTRLAYVVTGNKMLDDSSRMGLATLSRTLDARTSLSPGDPAAVDLTRDELAFYPLLYWPIAAEQPQPSSLAVSKLAAYMKNGGTVIFDTRDALTARPDGPPTPETRWLRQLLEGVDVPELERIPPDHVVTKTFYLLEGFAGRYNIGETWIEALPPPDPNDASRPARAGDSVSPVIITSNDLASAWAADRNGDPLYPLVPGGNRQREMSLRGGINLVMYTLTGNYKSDQVHVRDLLERLGH